MKSKVATTLSDKGIELPVAPSPVANYLPVVVAGRKVYVSGQICSWNGDLKYSGRLGADIDIDAGYQAARIAGLNIVAQLRGALGDLDRVKQVLRLNAYITSTIEFDHQPLVANGASDLMIEVFGEAGRHTRAGVGVAQLPLGAAVEVDAIVEID